MKKVHFFFQDDLNGPKYLLDGISYNCIVCEAFRCYINNQLKTNKSSFVMWSFIFQYLLLRKYDILRVLKEENYIKDHKKHILTGCFYGFEELNQEQSRSSDLKNIINKDQKAFTYKIPFSRETLSNLFLYCEFPKDHSESLIDHFFKNKNYNKILLYYKKTIFNLFKVDLKM